MDTVDASMSVSLFPCLFPLPLPLILDSRALHHLGRSALAVFLLHPLLSSHFSPSSFYFSFSFLQDEWATTKAKGGDEVRRRLGR